MARRFYSIDWTIAGISELDIPLAEDSRRYIFQTIWGAVLLLTGIGVFFRVPQVMPKIAQIEQFSGVTVIIRFCFYFIGIMLIGGGIKKIRENYRHWPPEKKKEK